MNFQQTAAIPRPNKPDTGINSIRKTVTMAARKRHPTTSVRAIPRRWRRNLQENERERNIDYPVKSHRT